MNKTADIISSLINNDLYLAESLNGLNKYNSKLKTTFQTNLLELKEITLNNTLEYTPGEFFFKLYILNGMKWEFHVYGWLKIEKSNNGSTVYFHTHESKIFVFSISNIEFNMRRRDDSLNHVVIKNIETSFLLYNPYVEVIDILFKKRFELFLDKMSNEIISVSFIQSIIDFYCDSKYTASDLKEINLLQNKLCSKFIIDIADGKIIDSDTIQNIAYLLKNFI